jgi:hypothetical protein
MLSMAAGPQFGMGLSIGWKTSRKEGTSHLADLGQAIFAFLVFVGSFLAIVLFWRILAFIDERNLSSHDEAGSSG